MEELSNVEMNELNEEELKEIEGGWIGPGTVGRVLVWPDPAFYGYDEEDVA